MLINTVTPSYLGWKPGANTIAYYPLNSTYTDTDQSGHNYNGTTTGTINYSSEYCTMNGSQYIDIPQIIPYGTNPFTISVWVRYPSSAGGGGSTIQQYNTSTNNTAISIGVGEGTCSSRSKGANDWANITTVNANEWYNLILVYDGSTLTFYKNGQVAGTKNRTISSTAPNLARIGRGGETWSDKYFIGDIGRLIIENKARTADEASDYYDQTKSKYGY